MLHLSINSIQVVSDKLVILIELLELHAFHKKSVLLGRRRTVQKLTGHVLSKNVAGIVKLQCVKVGYVVKLRSFGTDDTTICALDLEATSSIDREMSLDDDRLPIYFSLVGALSTVLDLDDESRIPSIVSLSSAIASPDHDSLFSILDETSETATTIRVCGLASKA